jgi:hypothetical protein
VSIDKERVVAELAKILVNHAGKAQGDSVKCQAGRMVCAVDLGTTVIKIRNADVFTTEPAVIKIRNTDVFTTEDRG